MSTFLCENSFVRRAYHHGNLREALIRQGVRLIEENGVNALTLREIGDRAGVSRTAAYRHFSDKSELLTAISEAAFTEFANALEAARNSAAPNAFDRLDAMGRAYLRFAAEHRAYYEVMFGLGCDIGARKVGGSPEGARAFGVLAGTIMEGQIRGEIRAGDTRMIATVIWATSHGIATLRQDIGLGTEEAAAQLMATLSELLRHGLAK